MQAELQEVMGQLAVLDDNLDMIQEQLDHQMGAQDENKDDARCAPPPACARPLKHCVH